MTSNLVLDGCIVKKICYSNPFNSRLNYRNNETLEEIAQI